MFKRSKPPLRWPRGSAVFLDPWPSSSDRVLHVVLHRGGQRRHSLDDLVAIALLTLLGTSGVVIGWGLFVS